MIKIYGAGLAGLLAGTMLRRHHVEIHEAKPSLPNNHHAVLRFRSDEVSRVTGIPFRKVLVNKGLMWEDCCYDTCDIRMSNMYSRKILGEIRNRSILSLETVERWVSPPDFISQLAASLEDRDGIHYESPFVWGEPYEYQTNPAISTIPMPALMNMSGFIGAPQFNYQAITVISGDIIDPLIDVFQTLYYPGSEQWYRASITGNHLMVEIMGQPDNDANYVQTAIRRVLHDFGISHDVDISNVDVNTQRLGKIAPIDNQLRKQFILAMSDKYNIYSLGRYATWRNILLDDVVQDVRRVEEFLLQRVFYSHRISQINS
jgi:hypothetical protein